MKLRQARKIISGTRSDRAHAERALRAILTGHEPQPQYGRDGRTFGTRNRAAARYWRARRRHAA